MSIRELLITAGANKNIEFSPPIFLLTASISQNNVNRNYCTNQIKNWEKRRGKLKKKSKINLKSHHKENQILVIL